MGDVLNATRVRLSGSSSFRRRHPVRCRRGRQALPRRIWAIHPGPRPAGQLPLRTRPMQELHQRLREEGIVINYPVHTLQSPRNGRPGPSGEAKQPETCLVSEGWGTIPLRHPFGKRNAPRTDDGLSHILNTVTTAHLRPWEQLGSCPRNRGGGVTIHTPRHHFPCPVEQPDFALRDGRRTTRSSSTPSPGSPPSF